MISSIYMSYDVYVVDIEHMNNDERTIKSIRVKDLVYHRAKVAAVISRKSLGQWIEEAIMEKHEREFNSGYNE